MPLINQPVVRTSQPQQFCPIDRSNEFGALVIEAIIPHLGASSVLNIVGARSGNTQLVVPGLPGLSLQSTANTTYTQYGGAWSRVAPPFSFLCLYQLNSAAVGGRIASNFSSGTYGYGFLPSTTNFRAALGEGAAANLILTGDSANLNVQLDILTVNASTASYYQRGFLKAGPTAHSYDTPTAVGNFRIGADNAASAAAPHRNYLCVLFNRELTANEVKRLTANPWQIFAPLSRKIWVPTSGAATHTTTGALVAGSALVAGTASNFTVHATSGSLEAGAAAVTGTANNFTIHVTSGSLEAGSAQVTGTAGRLVTHETTGALQAQSAQVSGTSVHNSVHDTSGTLVAGSAIVDGVARNGIEAQITGGGGWQYHPYIRLPPEKKKEIKKAKRLIAKVAKKVLEEPTKYEEKKGSYLLELETRLSNVGLAWEPFYADMLQVKISSQLTEEIKKEFLRNKDKKYRKRIEAEDDELLVLMLMH